MFTKGYEDLNICTKNIAKINNKNYKAKQYRLYYTEFKS